MPFIGSFWDLINIALESNCIDGRIICKEANIRPNARDNAIDKKSNGPNIDPCGTPEDKTFHSPQAEQHVAFDQLSSFWTIEVARRKRM